MEKHSKIKTEIAIVLTLKHCKIKAFASFVGHLVSSCPAAEYGWLDTKMLKRCKYLNLKKTQLGIKITWIFNSDVRWWRHAIDHSVYKIKEDNYDPKICFDDASTTGWGRACGA